MPTITIAASATVTLDGRVVSKAGTFTADVQQFTEQTVAVDATYVSIGPPASSANHFAAFYVVVNTGANDAVVRMEIASNEYLFFACPAGGHLVLPCGGAQDQTVHGFEALSARAVGAGTRLLVMVGLHD